MSFLVQALRLYLLLILELFVMFQVSYHYWVAVIVGVFALPSVTYILILIYISLGINIKFMNSQQAKPNNSESQVIVITGANTGLGYAVAQSFYKKGSIVIFGARSEDKNKKAVEQISSKYENQKLMFPHRFIVGLNLDLSDLKSIQQFVGQVRNLLDQKLGNQSHIDLLINNAAMLGTENIELVEPGIQKSVYVNYFGHFYLTYLLFSLIAKSKSAKIINLTSDICLKIVQCQQNQKLGEGQYAEHNIWDLSCSNKKYDSFQQYAVSKLFSHMFTVQLQNIINENNQVCLKEQKTDKVLHIKTGAIHPGFLNTTFGDHNVIVQDIKKKYGNLMVSCDEAAKGIIFISSKAQSEFVDDYYGQNGEKKISNQISRKVDKTRRLWELGEKIFKINFRELIKKHRIPQI